MKGRKGEMRERSAEGGGRNWRRMRAEREVGREDVSEWVGEVTVGTSGCKKAELVRREK
jgi:hypothetical protein